MKRRHQWTYPDADVTAGVWIYLRRRYPVRDARERRERLAETIRRFTAKGRSAVELHEALLLGVRLHARHAEQEVARRQLRRDERATARARRDVERAIVSLRRLLGDVAELEVFVSVRDALAPVDGIALRRSRRGAPVEHITEVRDALQRLGVPPEDRKDILDALGFMNS